jgi:hypothetical protein
VRLRDKIRCARTRYFYKHTDVILKQILTVVIQLFSLCEKILASQRADQELLSNPVATARRIVDARLIHASRRPFNRCDQFFIISRTRTRTDLNSTMFLRPASVRAPACRSIALLEQAKAHANLLERLINIKLHVYAWLLNSRAEKLSNSRRVNMRDAAGRQ